MIPFELDDLVARNLSDTMMDIAVQYIGCYNTTGEDCVLSLGQWKGHSETIPGNRMGCFDIINGACTCSEEMCDELSCISIPGMLWWNDCLDCQCLTVVTNGTAPGGQLVPTLPTEGGQSPSPPTPGGVSSPTPQTGAPPIPSGGGFGCYGVGGTFGACNCSPDLCSSSACAAVQVRMKQHAEKW